MEEFYKRLRAVRHHIHQHPELSNQEVETSRYLREKLEGLGIKILESSLKTGLVAELGQGKPVIALRADIDALPILEKTDLDYASQNKGVMHACGHDFHQTSLLGAAELLKAQESDLKGRLRLIFQPAEEISEGATAVLETGLLDDVEAIIGFHNMPQLPAGVLALKEGGVLAGVEKFKVSVEGVSSHAARPDFGVDTVLTLTSMIQNLQPIVSRTVAPFEPAVLSVTHIEAGATWNVLPQAGFFEGTIRTFNPELKQRIKEDFIRIVENTADNFGAKVAIEWFRTPPVTFNDAVLTALLFEKAKEYAQVEVAHPSTGGEDFAFYQEKIPGVFAFIGGNGVENAPDLHHDTFTVADEALPVAVNYYVESAKLLLEYYQHSTK